MKVKIFTQKKDDCWRISLCNLLGIKPKKVPHFVKLYGNEFVEETRKWLNARGKSIVYIPLRHFIESGTTRYNHSMFPQGKCIAVLCHKKKDKTTHAALMINGRIYEDPGFEEYRKVSGYFVVYDI